MESAPQACSLTPATSLKGGIVERLSLQLSVGRSCLIGIELLFSFFLEKIVTKDVNNMTVSESM